MVGTYYTFMPVRNCKSNIGDVLSSLINQTLPPKKIIIVDDGSTDGTSDILEEFRKENPDIIKVITTGSTTRDYSRIVKLWNMCIQRGYDYHMVAAGDTVFENEYAETIIAEMDKDSNTVVASGNNQEVKAVAPHGGGRFVSQDFFFRFYDKYPEIIGYESEILHRAQLNGYKTAVFDRARFTHTDPLGHKHNFSEFGQGMKALGYHPLYVLARVAYTRRWGMLWGYLAFTPKKTGYYSQFPDELKKQISGMQKQRMKRKLLRMLKISKE